MKSNINDMIIKTAEITTGTMAYLFQNVVPD